MTDTHDFQTWLRDRYGTPARLGGAWHAAFGSFGEAMPPAAADIARNADLSRWFDWATFRAQRAETAPGAATVLDVLPPAGPAWHDAAPLARWYGLARAACRELHASDAPPESDDIIRRVTNLSGVEPPAPFARATVIMHAACLGEAHPSARVEPSSRLHPYVRDAHAEGPWQPDRKVLVLYPRLVAWLVQLADARRTAGLQLPDFGFGRPIYEEGPSLLKLYFDLVMRAGYAFAVADTDCGMDMIERFPLVVCPTLELLSGGVMRRLDAWVRGGGFLALGPRIPLLDERLRSDDTLARHFGEGLSEFSPERVPVGSGCIFTLPGYASPATVNWLAFESGIAPGLRATADALDSAVHRSGNRRRLYVANPHRTQISTEIAGEPFAELRNPATGQTVRRDAPRIVVPAESIAAWDVCH